MEFAEKFSLEDTVEMSFILPEKSRIFYVMFEISSLVKDYTEVIMYYLSDVKIPSEIADAQFFGFINRELIDPSNLNKRILSFEKSLHGFPIAKKGFYVKIRYTSGTVHFGTRVWIVYKRVK